MIENTESLLINFFLNVNRMEWSPIALGLLQDIGGIMDTGVHVWATLAARHKNGQRGVRETAGYKTAITLPLLSLSLKWWSMAQRWRSNKRPGWRQWRYNHPQAIYRHRQRLRTYKRHHHIHLFIHLSIPIYIYIPGAQLKQCKNAINIYIWKFIWYMRGDPKITSLSW